MFKIGEKVRLVGNPLDEQLGETMEGGIKTIEDVKDVSDMEGTSGQWVKTDKYSDWLDSSYFESVGK